MHDILSKLILGSGIFALFFFALPANATLGPPPPQITTWGPTNNGFSLAIASLKEQYHVGEPISVLASVRYQPGQSPHFFFGDKGCVVGELLGFFATNGSGKKSLGFVAPCDDHNRAEMQNLHPGHADYLASGEVLTISVDLRKLFEQGYFSSPGMYQITGQSRLSGPDIPDANLTSNAMTVNVVP